MSFCPTKDIHSVYLDNELPDEYKLKYEKHLEECADCRQKLAKFKSVREMLKNDVESVTPDEQFLEDSYNRLMIKMSYNKNTNKTKKNSGLHFTYILSAAAAFMVALIIPIGLTSKKDNVMQSVGSLPSVVSMQQIGNNISFGSGKNIVVSGNIEEDVLSSNSIDCVNVNLSEDMSSIHMLSPKMKEDNIISIRIAIPNLGEIPVETKIDLEGLVASGNFEWNLLEN